MTYTKRGHTHVASIKEMLKKNHHNHNHSLISTFYTCNISYLNLLIKKFFFYIMVIGFMEGEGCIFKSCTIIAQRGMLWQVI